MEYKVGMYGGSFDPLHLGHIHDIIRAAGMCDELYVMISWSKERDFVSKEYRYRWILNSTKHLPNIKIILVEDKAKTKEEYNSDFYWENGAKEIKELIGKKIDVVFCGSDYLGSNRFESLYGDESIVYYFDRKEVPISSTEIRTWATDNWDYIPNIAKDYFTRKILILGGESSGKSTLVQNLALAYNTNFVSEVGRDTCEYAGGEEFMIVEDLYENLLKQKVNVMEASKKSNKLLFVDTDCLTTLFYSGFLFEKGSAEHKKCLDLALSINGTNTWDLVVFLEPDVEFVQDGTRSEEIKANREKYSNEIKELLKENNIEYVTINGSYNNRFDTCKKLIEEKFKITTKW